MRRWLLILAPLSFASLAGAAGYTAGQRAEFKKLHEDRCAFCHGVDGKAQTWSGKILEVPDQTDPRWQNSVTDEQLIEAIENGKGKMPLWSDELTAAQIRGIVKVVIRGFAPAK